jgi:hypothetical protein
MINDYRCLARTGFRRQPLAGRYPASGRKDWDGPGFSPAAQRPITRALAPEDRQRYWKESFYATSCIVRGPVHITVQISG